MSALCLERPERLCSLSSITALQRGNLVSVWFAARAKVCGRASPLARRFDAPAGEWGDEKCSTRATMTREA